MSAHCHDHHASPGASDPRYRKILWIALVLNAVMFFIELGAGFKSGSVSLLADAIDFFGDAVNYGVTLAVLSRSLAWRAWAAVLKGLSRSFWGQTPISLRCEAPPPKARRINRDQATSFL